MADLEIQDRVTMHRYLLEIKTLFPTEAFGQRSFSQQCHPVEKRYSEAKRSYEPYFFIQSPVKLIIGVWDMYGASNAEWSRFLDLISHAVEPGIASIDGKIQDVDGLRSQFLSSIHQRLSIAVRMSAAERIIDWEREVTKKLGCDLLFVPVRRCSAL